MGQQTWTEALLGDVIIYTSLSPPDWRTPILELHETTSVMIRNIITPSNLDTDANWPNQMKSKKLDTPWPGASLGGLRLTFTWAMKKLLLLQSLIFFWLESRPTTIQTDGDVGGFFGTSIYSSLAEVLNITELCLVKRPEWSPCLFDSVLRSSHAPSNPSNIRKTSFHDALPPFSSKSPRRNSGESTVCPTLPQTDSEGSTPQSS